MDDRALLALSWIVAAVAVGWSVVAYARRRRETAALEDVARAARRLAAGESHVVAPLSTGAVGEIARLVNSLGDLVRREQLKMHPERIFDQAMLRETPNALIIVDGRGVIQGVNPSARSLLPWKRDPVGALAAEVVPLPEWVAVLREAADTRRVAEATVRSGMRDLLVRGLPLADGGGTLGVVLDITSVVAAERVRREFVANVSHELRTPVTAIVGYAESLLDEEIPQTARALLDPLVRNAMRLARLCEDVLALSRIEARVSDLPLERTAVRPLVEEVADSFHDRAKARRSPLVVEGSEDITAYLNADAFCAALRNLVDNALKYGPEGAPVFLQVSDEPEGVMVSVLDAGPGIDSEHHARLFERFYRVDAGRTRDAGGTGLGLALVKHYCRAMGAEVSLRSAPGEGSSFTLRLPKEGQG